MPTYPSNHYDTPATYVVATVPERGPTTYELVHYDDTVGHPPSHSLAAVLALAERMDLPVYDRVFYPHTSRWVRVDRVLYLEQMTQRASMHGAQLSRAH